MARPRLVDDAVAMHAAGLAVRATTVDDLRCAQAILLPALLGATLEQTAAALGVSRATVGRLQSSVRRRLTHPTELDPQWGGRRNAVMSWEQEIKFLAPWAEQCVDGQLLVAAPLRAALAKQLGRPVTHSVVYRMLARHGWRKVAPDTRHPKSDPVAQEQWKKTPRNAGSVRPIRRRQRTPNQVDVSRRGTLWPHGAHQALLG